MDIKERSEITLDDLKNYFSKPSWGIDILKDIPIILFIASKSKKITADVSTDSDELWYEWITFEVTKELSVSWDDFNGFDDDIDVAYILWHFMGEPSV